MTRNETIAAAAELLGATEYSETGPGWYRWTAEDGMVYECDEDDLLALGRALASGQPDAYSLWCQDHGELVAGAEPDAT